MLALVTNPVGAIVATVGAVLLHTPPVLVVASSVVKPIHTPGLPVIVFGSAFIVMSLVLVQPIPCV
jgi:hypothetical protein